MMLLSLLVAVGSLAAGQAPPLTAPADYVAGPQDVLSIVVFGEADLSKTVALDADGSFDFPYVGRVQASGLTARAIGERLARGLGIYYRNPQVSVEVTKFQSQSVIVLGFVNAPGRYPLAGNVSVLSILAAAGSPTAAAAPHVVISRPAGSGPRLPDDEPGGGSSLKLTLQQLQSGPLPEGFALRDGDTISVPRAETVYVTGEVKATGPIVLDRPMTVLQVISMAGGVTDKGAINRVKIHRLVDGKVQDVKGVKLSDVVKPGDTIEVPQRYF